MKKLYSLILALIMGFSLVACGSTEESTSPPKESTSEIRLVPQGEISKAEAKILPSGYAEGWTPRVEQALNDFYAMYGKDSENYDEAKKPYVVFDFDNTTSIFDIQEQANVYMLNHMTFAIPPEKAYEVFMTGIAANTVVKTDSDYRVGGQNSGLTFEAWATDCATAYGRLHKKYAITPQGIQDKATLDKLHADPDWQEFSAKMSCMYDAINHNFPLTISYPWGYYWFTGMSEKQAYDVLFASHTFFGQRDFKWHKETFASPADYDSQIGPVSYDWSYGITVAKEMVQLWKDLKANGFNIYVCSASMTDTILAAVDAFGLGDYCDGVMAMTIQLDENDVYTNSYDYKTGYSWWRENGKWVKGHKAIKTQTSGIGKVTAIKNILVDKYGYGPVAGFMDSTGDYNFCTEFDSLKMVLSLNCLRTATDGGGIITIIGMKQTADGLDLATANANGDVLYLVNGRDENGGYLIEEQGSVPFEKDYTLFQNDDLQKIYDWYLASDLTTGQFINQFAIQTPADGKNNEVGVAYGFLEEYDGYKNIK